MVPDDPLHILRKYVRSEGLYEHCIATGAIMRSVAPIMSGDPDLWEAIGILHDIDFEMIEGDMKRHGVEGEQILLREGVSDVIAEAVRRHNHHLFSGYTTSMDITLQAADSISGLIIACALVKGGAIDEVTTKTVRKKMKDKGFAAGCDRDRIRAIESQMDQDTFITAAIAGVTSVWRRPVHD